MIGNRAVGMAFISVVMLWSNAILNEMKRYVITGTIALWYMHKVGDYETPRIPTRQFVPGSSRTSQSIVSNASVVSSLVASPSGLVGRIITK